MQIRLYSTTELFNVLEVDKAGESRDDVMLTG
jgi:hypothetical protein